MIRRMPVSLVLGFVAAALAQPEFNWIPSGTLAVGDRASEAEHAYESTGERIRRERAYPGEPPRAVTGRNATRETFTIRPGSYRGGPAPGHIAIWRTLDSADGPVQLQVLLGAKELGPWQVTPPDGVQGLYDALFVIPKSAWTSKDRVPEAVEVTIVAAAPSPSLGYRFYITRDWDVLGEDLAGDIGAAAAKNTPFGAYLNALIKEGAHDWAAAQGLYGVRDEDNAALERLARAAIRRMQLRQARAAARAQDPTGREARPTFAPHYRLGVLAGAWGCWDDAVAELQLATAAHPTHCDATYRLAEALEYCRRPIAEWAPLCERAGLLGESQRALRGGTAPTTRVEDVLVAIHTDAVKDLCGAFSQESMTALQRDWRYVEQLVYGASRGAWKLRTHFMVCDENAQGTAALPWNMHLGWLFLPPDATTPVGTYDYSIGTAEYGSSHAGGVDCGVSGAGGAQIGPTRSWEVLLHEWNHEFDWVAVCAEQVPAYPATHDSDGCGKQPIVSMGCGHQASMRYYINPAEYRRHEGSTRPLVPSDGVFVREWQLGPMVAAPTPDGALETWLVQSGRMKAERIAELKRDWESQKKAEQDAAARPAVVKRDPPPKPVPDWAGFLQQQWWLVKLLDELAAPEEAAFVRGAPLTAAAPLRTLRAEPEFVDLRATHADAPDKCVAYVRTYIQSPDEREVRFWIGYNDTAAMWLNARQIHKGNYYACAKWEDANRPYMLAQSGTLQPGWNCLALKVERGGGDWGFSVHITDFENRPVPGLTVKAELPAGAQPNRYTPPAAGQYYRWAEVQEDWQERLPRLTAESLAAWTGIAGLELGPSRFFLKLPDGAPAAAGSRYLAQPDDKDAALNNYLNWDREAAAALRFTREGQVRDLLVVRPEYLEDFLLLLPDAAAPGGLAAPAADRVLGYLRIDRCDYATTPGRGARAALVLETSCGEYPPEDLDLLRP